jgi:hypothetical protein
VTDPVAVAVGLLGALGIAASWRLYLMANDPVTRLRDCEGRAIDPADLEDDEPREMRRPPE